jgi:hypothetical protein
VNETREQTLIRTGRVVLEQCCRILRTHESADWETRGMPDWLAEFKATIEGEVES